MPLPPQTPHSLLLWSISADSRARCSGGQAVKISPVRSGDGPLRAGLVEILQGTCKNDITSLKQNPDSVLNSDAYFSTQGSRQSWSRVWVPSRGTAVRCARSSRGAGGLAESRREAPATKPRRRPSQCILIAMTARTQRGLAQRRATTMFLVRQSGKVRLPRYVHHAAGARQGWRAAWAPGVRALRSEPRLINNGRSSAMARSSA